MKSGLATVSYVLSLGAIVAILRHAPTAAVGLLVGVSILAAYELTHRQP